MRKIKIDSVVELTCKTEDCSNKVKSYYMFCADCLMKDDGYVQEWVRRIEHEL